MTDLQTHTVDAEEFARGVATTPDDQLAAGMASESRPLILDEIFRRMETHFQARRAEGVDAVVRFRINGAEGTEPDRYEATIRGGECHVTKTDLVERPNVTLTIDGVEFLKLVTGNANGPELFMRRKLKVKGDLMLAARLAGLFHIPRGAA